MTWRHIQLGNDVCDQDSLILSLFSGQSVRYVGSDLGFCEKLSIDIDSPNLILIINEPHWVSEIQKILETNLLSHTEKFYVGINRYQVVGNDTDIEFNITDQKGQDIINMMTFYVNRQGFTVLKTGRFDQDRGRYFNFVQPLTWMYGTNETNHCH
jgi:hypothetical protein